MVSAALLWIISFFSFWKQISSLCALLGIHKISTQSLPLYTSCLFPMPVNDNIVEIEKPDGICSLTFVVDEFSELFLHPSIFSIIHSQSA